MWTKSTKVYFNYYKKQEVILIYDWKVLSDVTFHSSVADLRMEPFAIFPLLGIEILKDFWHISIEQYQLRFSVLNLKWWKYFNVNKEY